MKRWLFYKQKSTVVYPGQVKRRGTDEVIILKAGMVFISGGGVVVVVFLGSPGSFITETSVLSCTNRLEAPFFPPLCFISPSEKHYRKLFKMSNPL